MSTFGLGISISSSSNGTITTSSPAGTALFSVSSPGYAKLSYTITNAGGGSGGVIRINGVDTYFGGAAGIPVTNSVLIGGGAAVTFAANAPGATISFAYVAFANT